MYVSPCTVLYSISPHTMHWAKHKINKILTQKLCFKRIQENCEQKARTRWNLNCFLISCTPSHQKKSRVPNVILYHCNLTPSIKVFHHCQFMFMSLVVFFNNVVKLLDILHYPVFCKTLAGMILKKRKIEYFFLGYWKSNHFRALVIQFCAKHRKTVGAKRGK